MVAKWWALEESGRPINDFEYVVYFKLSKSVLNKLELTDKPSVFSTKCLLALLDGGYVDQTPHFFGEVV